MELTFELHSLSPPKLCNLENIKLHELLNFEFFIINLEINNYFFFSKLIRQTHGHCTVNLIGFIIYLLIFVNTTQDTYM